MTQTTTAPSSLAERLRAARDGAGLTLDAAAGRITVDGRERQLRDAADEREVCAAYLFLLYAVRGAAPGQRIPLRSSDVELLREVVGEDAETIERRLVHLMGCTPGEATRLRSVLLRHRAVTAAVGATAALSWVAVVAPGASDTTATAPSRTAVSATPISGETGDAAYFDVDAPAVEVAVPAPVQDQLDGSWSPSYPSTAGGEGDPS